MYTAVAVSLLGGLLLLLTDKVIALSFAQLAAFTGWVYIGYALIGIFWTSLLPAFITLMALAILVIVVIFGESLFYYRRQRAYGDMALGAVMVVAAAFICSYPLYVIVRSALAQ
jgi:hypothetical protein